MPTPDATATDAAGPPEPRAPEPAMPFYCFDVAVSSHDLLQKGVTAALWTCVTVAADDPRAVDSDRARDRAAEIACQMAARHGMPTACLDRV